MSAFDTQRILRLTHGTAAFGGKVDVPVGARRVLNIIIRAAHAPMEPVYTRFAYLSRDLRLAGLLFSQRVVV